MTFREAVRPVYMPPWVRVAAIVFGCVVALPPAIHMAVHVWLLIQGKDVADSGSEAFRFARIVFGGGIMFPDPVIGMILAWRRRKQNTEERETP